MEAVEQYIAEARRWSGNDKTTDLELLVAVENFLALRDEPARALHRMLVAGHPDFARHNPDLVKAARLVTREGHDENCVDRGSIDVCNSD